MRQYTQDTQINTLQITRAYQLLLLRLHALGCHFFVRLHVYGLTVVQTLVNALAVQPLLTLELVANLPAGKKSKRARNW